MNIIETTQLTKHSNATKTGRPVRQYKGLFHRNMKKRGGKGMDFAVAAGLSA